MANNIIDRSGALALIPEEETKTIIQGAIANSVVLSRFKKLPNMASKIQSMPVLSMLPTAYFVDGDTGFAKTTKQMWNKKKIVAAALKVIVPIPNDVLDDMQDAGYDFEGEVLPRIEEAIGRAVDAAVLFGENKPTEWRTPLVQTAIENNCVVYSTDDLYKDILGTDGVFAKVEDNGFDVNGVLSGIKMKSELRELRDTTGQPIFKRDVQNSAQYMLDGAPMSFSVNGTWDNDVVKMIAGDFSQAVYAFRKDMTAKLLTEGVIQDESTKEIVYNLAQQDMVALMVTCRLGWEIPNPINAENESNVKRLPFAILTPETVTIGYTVTFNVVDSDGNALEGAEVDFAGAIDLTDSDGACDFANITDGKTLYKVTLDGYKVKRGKVTVDGADVTVTVTLEAKE